MAVQWLVKGEMDFSVDVEIDGTPVNQVGLWATLAGDTDLITPAAGMRLKIYRVTYTVAANVTGEIIIKLGAVTLSRVQNPMAGAVYGFNLSPNFVRGLVDTKLIVTLPAGPPTVDIDVCYEEIA